MAKKKILVSFGDKVDLIRDIFIITKEPFKRKDLILELSQAELLSISSTAEIYSKIINRECRKLTSSGYDDIAKYFRRHFDIEINNFAPGKSKIEEYHDRRHLLIHRLGKTDIQFRKKYNYSKQSIVIEEDYLMDCIKDFKEFSVLLNNQVEFYLQDIELSEIVEKEPTERETKIELTNANSASQYLQNKYEFWVDDEFVLLSDIIVGKQVISENELVLSLSGRTREIKTYLGILKSHSKKDKFKTKVLADKVKPADKVEKQIKWLDEKTLQTVSGLLPPQPWEKGIHKEIAEKLGTTNKLISMAIQQLIMKKVFKPQIDGAVYEHTKK